MHIMRVTSFRESETSRQRRIRGRTVESPSPQNAMRDNPIHVHRVSVKHRVREIEMTGIAMRDSAGFMQHRPNPPKPTREVEYLTAQWDYIAAEDDEISMKTGDVIEFLAPNNEEWSEGKNTRTGQVGLFPVVYMVPRYIGTVVSGTP